MDQIARLRELAELLALLRRIANDAGDHVPDSVRAMIGRTLADIDEALGAIMAGGA